MLELLINGRQADIKETSIIAITKTYENSQNPLNYYSDYSKTVKLPITRNNNAIFNNFNRLDSLVTDTTIDPKSKLPFILLNNQEPIMEGYVKLENANTIWTDEEYEITLFSTFGLIMNELKLLTFNPNAQDLDPKYVIDTPFTDVKIDRNLIKRSFEQETHSLDGDSVTDWIGFIPTYQGKYTDFASDREQLLASGRTDDMTRERDEHYKREFRSYYQQPFIWVDKLWKAAQDKIAEITDYSLVLDNSWFFPNNPYYKDLIYTCPNIFNSGSDFKETTQVFTDKKNEVVFHRYNRSGSDRLNTIHTEYLTDLTSGSGDIYVDGVFNPDSDKGTTVFKGSFQAILFAYSSIPNGNYAKITDDNPIYIKVKAVNANTNEDIFGASKTFLLYSDDTDANRWTYDEAIDLSISKRGDLPATIGDRTPQYTPSDGFAWKTTLNVELNIMENVPYRICFETWNLNNDKPFEWINSNPVLTPTWDWVWTDFFTAETGKGYSIWIDTVGARVTTVDNTRSGSDLTLYRIFPKETTLCDVLLKYSKIFGLMWKIDEDSKTVTVMTRDEFFAYSAIKDWTGKIDRSKEFRFSPLCFDTRYVEFNYGEGQCGRLKKYEDYYQYTYGTKKIDTEFDFNADTNKLFDNLVPSVISQKRQYSKMMNTEYEDRPNFMGYSYMVYPDEHFVDNDDNGENAGMSGAFYFRNGTFTPDPRLSNWDSQGNYVFAVTDDTEHMIKTQEYCWNSCGENVTLCYKFPDVSTISNPYGGYRYSVHFEAPKEYFFRDGASEDIKYVYNTFWENYINERYATQNKKLTAYVYLSIDDFKELDFTEFINIDNILYHIDKVYDFNPNSNDPTKVDLTQVWDLTAYKGDGAGFPYIYTAHDRYTINDDETTITVHASGEWEIANAFTREPWLTATKNGNSLTLHATGSTVLPRMQNLRIYLSDNPTVAWTIKVTQVNYTGRLNITPETLVFPETGGTQTVIVDSSNTANNAITISTSARWLSARITDYNDNSLRRNVLHMEVTAAPSIDTRTRSGSVTLTMTDGGQQYTATLHVGQQCADFHIASREDNVINDNNSIVILDRNGNRVTNLVSGETYTFEDLFPEETDLNTLSITNGFAKISGTSGKQTVTFTPQLSDGDTTGGGVIKIKTLNGNYISYPYNVDDGSTPPTPPEPDPDMRKTYFYVEDVSGQANTLKVVNLYGSGPTFEVFKSTDQVNWESMGVIDTAGLTATIPANGKLYLKANTDTWNSGDIINSCNIHASGAHNVGGNIMSLLYGDNFQDQTKFPAGSSHNFEALFRRGNNKIRSAANLVLPATTLTPYCYSNMFTDGGNTVTEAPVLPATTLAEYCYYEMFRDCTSLTTAPELPATTLVNNCYQNMFANCTTLNSVTTYAIDISASNCLTNWLNNVAATGDFYNFGGAEYLVDSASGIPTGWTEHGIAPTPTSRRVTVKSDGEEGYFRISASGMEPKTTTLFDSKLNDGTVITLTAVPNDGYTFSKYVCGSSTYTTPTARFTIDSSLVTDNMILIYVYFEKAAVMGKLTVNSGTGGKVTIGSTAPAASITRSVAIGSTVTNIRAIPDTNYTFQKWSDGAISNPRDYVVNGDVAITALFSGGSVTSHEITVDGTGLGRNSTIQLYLDNDLKTRTSTGETNTEQYPEGTYSMEVECTISDISSKFNSFKINSSEFFTNPYRAQTNLDRNLYITAVTIPSGIYWSNTNAVDDLMAEQSILLDFNHEDIVEKPTVPTGRESEITIAIPTDYSVEIVVNSDGEDVTEAFTVKTTDNGNWNIWYTEQSAETDDYTFSLVLA